MRKNIAEKKISKNKAPTNRPEDYPYEPSLRTSPEDLSVGL